MYKWAALTLLALCWCKVTNAQETLDYGVIIDAGSSGSRVRIYSWYEGAWIGGQNGRIPKIDEVHNLKIRPGISEFAGDTSGVAEYLNTLIMEAKGVIPESRYRSTRIYLFATAGMRLLMEDEGVEVMDAIDRVLLDTSINPFEYESLNSRILSGEEEGVFAWITVNFLRGFFSNTDDMETAGILELGGASAQIAFHHNADILADKFPVTIGGTIYPLYVHSYLGFGQELVLDKVQELAVERELEVNGERLNPCMIAQDNITETVYDLEVVTFRGTGDPLACQALMEEIVYGPTDESHCLPQPCAIGTVYQPSVDETMPFFALSAYQYTLFELKVPDPADGSFTAGELRDAATAVINMNLPDAEAFFERENDAYNSIRTTMGLYLATMLEKAFGFSPTSRQLYALPTINEQPVQWALGALIYEMERSAAECEVDPMPSAATPHVGSTVLSITVSLLTLFVYFISGY